MTPAA
jgi:inosine-uridine nucleoside N-ribohydrolase